MNEEEFKRLEEAYLLKADIDSCRNRIHDLKELLNDSQLLQSKASCDYIDQDLLVDAIQKQITRYESKVYGLELEFRAL